MSKADIPNEDQTTLPLPKLHILKLHVDPAENGNYEKFSRQWFLDDDEGSSPTTTTKKKNPIILPGDVLFFPNLLSGAGEFEGVRFVGKRQNSKSNYLILHNGGVEYPEFPIEILSLQPIGRSLRSAYGELLDKMLTRSHNFLLEDAMGGPDEVEEYWKKPAILREKERSGEWVIPLKNCEQVETIDFSSVSSSHC